MRAHATPLVLLALAAAAAAAPAMAQTPSEHRIEVHEFGAGAMHAYPESIRARVGETLEVTVVNPEANERQHNLVFCAEAPHEDSSCGNVLAQTSRIPPGGSETVTFTLSRAGTFEYFCDILGHKQATPGMKGLLLVEGGENESPGWPAVATLLGVAGVALALRRR